MTEIDKSNARVQRMFGAIAPKYDSMNHLLSLNVDRYWRRKAVRAISPVGAEPILDNCAGTGDLAIALSKASSTTPIVATDFCREMLDIGRQKTKQQRLDGQIQFVEADAQQLPFKDKQFQGVTIAFGLRNVLDPDQALREMARVCRVGGKVAVLEFSMPRFRPWGLIYGWYFNHVLPRIGQWFVKNDHDAYKYLPSTVQEFPSGDALAKRMQAAGLEDVAVHALTLGVVTLYTGVRPKSIATPIQSAQAIHQPCSSEM